MSDRSAKRTCEAKNGSITRAKAMDTIRTKPRKTPSSICVAGDCLLSMADALAEVPA